jgi:hypothetical protein
VLGVNTAEKELQEQAKAAQENADKLRRLSEETANRKIEAENRVAVATAEMNAATEKAAAARYDAEADAATRVSDLKRSLLEDEERLSKEVAQNEIDNFQDVIRENEKMAGMRVKEAIDAAKASKDEAESIEKDEKRASRIRGKLSKRGVKVSKEDREFIDAFDKIGGARDAVNVAQQNIAERQKITKDISNAAADLAKIRLMQEQLLSQG